MAKTPNVASPRNSNPKLGDYLKARGSSARPPTKGRTQGGGLPRNKKP
jgi:hypothetical protein